MNWATWRPTSAIVIFVPDGLPNAGQSFQVAFRHPETTPPVRPGFPPSLHPFDLVDLGFPAVDEMHLEAVAGHDEPGAVGRGGLVRAIVVDLAHLGEEEPV